MATLSTPTAEAALPGRSEPIPTAELHFVSGAPLRVDIPGAEVAMFAMGCFWGVERKFWLESGVITTMSGYAGGSTPNPTYREVCSGHTGHAEVVRLAFDPSAIRYEDLLR